MYAYPEMQVNALNESWEISSDDEDYDDDVWTAREAEWPNRGRFNTLPSLSALIRNHCPAPITTPAPLSNEHRDMWNVHCAKVDEMEKEKAVLRKKLGDIELQLMNAEKAPQNYSAAKWGAQSARDSLIKRLTAEVNAAYEIYNGKGREIDAFKATRKHLGEYIELKESMDVFHAKCKEEIYESCKIIYGYIDPIKDHIMIPLLVNGASCIRSGEIRCQGSESTLPSEEDFSTYQFPNEHILGLTMKRLELGGYENMRYDTLKTLTVFHRK